jgi:hypothetical protein
MFLDGSGHFCGDNWLEPFFDFLLSYYRSDTSLTSLAECGGAHLQPPHLGGKRKKPLSSGLALIL